MRGVLPILLAVALAIQPSSAQMLGFFGAGGVAISTPTAFWNLDEASGTRNDAVGSNHLTDNNTVTQAVGKVESAAQFTAANTEFLSIADNTDLSTGDIDFTWAGWVYADSLNTSVIVRKGTAADEREYALYYGTSRFRFIVSSTGLAWGTEVAADTFGAPSTGTWYYIVAWHDSAADTINIQVNNGTVDSAAHLAGVRDGTGSVYLGASQEGSPIPWDGRIDAMGFWKQVLTADERTRLYNNGNGRQWPW